MTERWAQALLAAAVFLGAHSAWADGLSSLEAFLRNTKSGRAEFTQTVTLPAREGQAARNKTSSGSFEFQRPDRFRFQYAKPFEQTIVADGQTLWLHDVDLNQVTARPQAQALGSTPAALIASAADLAAVRRDFTLESLPDAGGLQWVEATPRAREGSVRAVRLGFRGDALAQLEILDSFGQRSVLSFQALQVNVPIAPQRLRFSPPTGADVVRQ